MKYLNLILIAVLLISACEKEENNDNTENDLNSRAEKYLSLKSSEQIYSDENNNKYLTVVFDINKTEAVYGIFMEKDKKYNISVSGERCYDLDFDLLKSDKDTLFYGEYVMDENPRKYIAWKSNVTDTFFIVLNYTENINFNIYEFRITFEELTNKELKINDLNLLCSGDWSVDDSGNILLACHQTNFTKYAKIVNDSLFNYEFSYSIAHNSGIPDNYTGVAFYASQSIFDMENMPASCYNFDIRGPAAWRISYWYVGTGGGVGFEYGRTSKNLNIGVGAWNSISVKTFGDSINCFINGEDVVKFRNISFMNNGLYITIKDTKQDTVYIKDISLIK